ncbi:MAG: sulfatase [Candidatus Solibacter usitatus]|nr:sulfatase [Candidatus Solibacter usitatus]
MVADDLGAMDLACYGSRYHITTNLDSLATSGLQFTQAYAACPVCSPTRASLLTGRYPGRLHLTDWIPGRRQWPSAKLLAPAFAQQLPLEEITLAEMLKKEGYVTASIGKWHLGGKGFLPVDQGFDLNYAGTERGSPPSYFPPYQIPGVEESFDQEYLTDNLTRRAEKFLEENREIPFFLYLPHFAVHTPLQAKREKTEFYQRRAGMMKAQSEAVYAAMLESLDEGVGRIVKKLEELQIADNTAIFFLSDNGGLRYEGSRPVAVTNNAPLRAGKGHLFEGGIRIPMIVRWPGVTKRSTTCDVPVCTIDILPTVADLLKLNAPKCDGISIASLLRGGKRSHRDTLYWHYPHYSNQGGVPAGAVRNGQQKLIEFYEDGRLELYDLKTDPGEKRNLARRLPQAAKKLQEQLRRWRESVDAAMPNPNPAYDEIRSDQKLTGYEQPTPPA